MEFDLQKLKKRHPFPFETIAVGISFSPRMEPILIQAKKIADSCNSKLVLIHIGNKTQAKEKLLGEVLFRNNIDEKKTKIIWAKGETVDTILKLCKLNIVDLLIIGALEKENIIRFYLGSVARSICRRAKCSVLLLTHTLFAKENKQKIIVDAVPDHPKTIHSANTALYFARQSGIKEITLVHEIHVPALTMAMAESSSAPELTRIKKEFSEEETTKLNSLVSQCTAGNPTLHTKAIKGKPGYAIRQFAENKKVDLLVINSPDMHLTLLDRIFTHDIEYILANLPCNLLIVHSRV